MGLTFFGLTTKDAPLIRKNLFKMIHDIVFHGNGGFDYETVYHMPIWLRKFTFKEIQDHFNKLNKQSNPEKSKSLISEDGTVNTPEFLKVSKEYKGKTSYK